MKGKDLAVLTAAERADHCRRFANEAVQNGEASMDPVKRAEYFALASKWYAFVVDAEGISGQEASQSARKGASARSTVCDLAPIHLQIDYYKFDQHLGPVEYAPSVAEAHKDAIAGLARFGADRAKISDKDDGGKAIMVISG